MKNLKNRTKRNPVQVNSEKGLHKSKKNPTGLKVACISIEKREKQSQLPVKYIVLRLVKVPQLKLSWVKIGLKLTQDLQRFVKLENIPECRESI